MTPWPFAGSSILKDLIIRDSILRPCKRKDLIYQLFKKETTLWWARLCDGSVVFTSSPSTELTICECEYKLYSSKFVGSAILWIVGISFIRTMILATKHAPLSCKRAQEYESRLPLPAGITCDRLWNTPIACLYEVSLWLIKEVYRRICPCTRLRIFFAYNSKIIHGSETISWDGKRVERRPVSYNWRF